ncbi:hypothetical protein BAUCODRAFT_28731 [Baudoinia panamericana UAMH 10762]|uniref:Deacetylase sirtuin-type domain-containing protein n=1 Tax=Baudoinia panamericana (strain UAMH 10762) TaxID=717646 RepID=M2M067_BAUPA|nr:uncharacterized protein BAUCODRAFT_28731 [Baudoinia panamericana UAMH 10762]EMD00383.1 hypothetical protein BAUCODRAFT_28731 [Baudoinia panamericana UAMH 10762]
MDDTISDVSSALSSPPSSVPSSPLSSCVSSPEPPDFLRLANMVRAHSKPPYPSPPASQQTSLTGSPTPDGMDSNLNTDTDGPPPKKRRRIYRDPKERTTEYLDLRSGAVSFEQQEHLDRVLNVLHKRQKIVVIAGAGMSKSAGIPDFRSKNGLFSSLKKEHNLKGSGQHLFDASVYKDDASTKQFHQMITQMSRLVKDAKPTPFHHMLATIAKEERLLRLYSQNVDCLETNMEPLRTRIPLTKDANGKWPRTLQLHGGLDKMVCTKCHEIYDLDPELFDTSDAPLCSECEKVNSIRTSFEGKRSHGIGRLRPRMVLYHEDGPDNVAIGTVTAADLKRKPDAVLVVGTTLKVKGLQRIVMEMCKTVRDRKDGGLAIWINPELPPTTGGFRDLFDIIVQGTCDEVANRAAMPRWDEPAVPDDYREVSERQADSAAAMQAEVFIPRCQLTEAIATELTSNWHLNNSFRPPNIPNAFPAEEDLERRRPRPGDWSPISSRGSSVLSSIELSAYDSDSITVSPNGLLTPSKSRRTTPTSPTKSKQPKARKSIADMLKDNGKTKKAVVKSGKPSIAAKTKKSSVKYVKKALSKLTTKVTSVTKLKPQASGKVTNHFTQSKASAVSAKDAAAKDKLTKPFKTPSKTPSKLRQVSNVSAAHEPMSPLSEQDARVNKSPVKVREAVFPGLVTARVGAGGKRKRGPV